LLDLDILDEEMNALPIGEVGLMWCVVTSGRYLWARRLSYLIFRAGGAGISMGYIGLPEKTAERYKIDPFLNNGGYMFNTGDLGRWTSEGQLEHLGRIDDQVKVKVSLRPLLDCCCF
jgi:acyl-CoA synthetase (AMP-forming)/AMP-acid ligase II